MSIATWRISCDSLSNLYLWHIKYSSTQTEKMVSWVVIRFQICIFDILNTATVYSSDKKVRCDSLSNLYLWHIKYSNFRYGRKGNKVVIRFQICIFDILNTARSKDRNSRAGCDSLSNLYLWHIKYSTRYILWTKKRVVIRFQICIFDILNTAWELYNGFLPWLWFAFKFVSLTY